MKCRRGLGGDLARGPGCLTLRISGTLFYFGTKSGASDEYRERVMHLLGLVLWRL